MSRAIQHLGRFAVLAVGACAPVALAPDVTPATPQRQATPSAAPSDTPTDATASPWANLMRAKPDPPPSPEPPPPPEPQAAPSIEPPPPSLEPRATSLEIAPGTRCRVDWTSFGLHEEGARILISGIAAIETTGGDGCAKQVFYDEAIERKLSCVGVPDCSVELLEGGALYPAGSPDDPEGIVFRDLDFDGHRDLCVQVAMGAYNYSQRCFLFRPRKKTFERYPPLDPVIWMTVDPDKREIRHGMRISGSIYGSAVYRWVAGQLTLFEEKVVTGEEREQVSRRVGGRMVLIYDGPPRE